MNPRSFFKQLMHDTVKARVIRGSVVTVMNVVGTNGLRLLSNLVLTRILFPEAFGLMALVQIFIYGLHTFSNIGLNASIIQSKRGDDLNFVNTIWTLQIIRGFVLWIGACLLAYPAALIYDQPILQILLPVVGLTVVIEGFKTTREAQANRHIRLERIVLLSLISQATGLVCMVLLALALKSVWALVYGSIIGAVLRVVLFQFFLPGDANRFNWDKTALHEILSFGSFIFLSTIASFFIAMGERSILGGYLSLEQLGVYSVGILIGTIPGLVINAISKQVLFPLYRVIPPSESQDNQRNVFRVRRLVSLAALLISTVIAFMGVWLINLLYDPRYALAGPMVVLSAFRSVPRNFTVGTEDVLLANGDSRRYFYLLASTAIVQIIATFTGVHYLGIGGALIASGIANLILYPLRARFCARYAAWDPLGELGFMAAGFFITGIACIWQWDELAKLMGKLG